MESVDGLLIRPDALRRVEPELSNTARAGTVDRNDTFVRPPVDRSSSYESAASVVTVSRGVDAW
jgi:hypothetical protein